MSEKETPIGNFDTSGLFSHEDMTSHFFFLFQNAIIIENGYKENYQIKYENCHTQHEGMNKHLIPTNKWEQINQLMKQNIKD